MYTGRESAPALHHLRKMRDISLSRSGQTTKKTRNKKLHIVTQKFQILRIFFRTTIVHSLPPPVRAVALSIINIFAYWTFAMVKVWHASTSRLLTASTGTLPDMPHTTARRTPPPRRRHAAACCDAAAAAACKRTLD